MHMFLDRNPLNEDNDLFLTVAHELEFDDILPLKRGKLHDEFF
jgi:hypothetical protein